ncbi:putative D-amino-acid oxidase [Lyophyllum shimeji]|uniref:D-amino-acid oxidase n=1 Tax=Lyophyllum shimeji TaxID=47721 RepID=A0A9P3PNX7_LYOSH|nr:putative D-amino-acid oxidase [Lyophyllum shimeji]
MGSVENKTKNVVVLGAGVVGLTTALKIQERRAGYQVSIVAEVLPTDAKTTRYTSQWAGAHHVLNVTEDARQQKMDLETFAIMWELSKPGTETEQYFKRITQTEYYSDKKFLPPLERFPDYKVLDQDALPAGIAHGSTFTTLTIDTPNYLRYLARRFTSAGGQIVRGSVQHISQVLEGGASIFSTQPGNENLHLMPGAPDAVVVCTGLGTRFLGGVEDKSVHPIRGQTVLVRAPWIDFGRTIGNDDGWTYVIARRSGDVILGGTRDVNDWYPRPRPEATRDILERTFAMCPELAPPEVRAQREPTIEDVLPLVIEEGCGLRPGRTGGIRLDTEWRRAGAGEDGRKIPVVFNYGHGGYGFQSSWGSANLALKLLEEAMDGKY